MVSRRLMWELCSRRLLNINQFGFMKDLSTIDCLILIEDKVLETFALNQHMISVFFDIEKAYDSVWRDNIIRTLYDWNIKGNMLHFIKKFLSNRSFYVMIENTRSNRFFQENGVPQVEILSVCLFLVAINSIQNCIPTDIDFSLFADDLTISVSSMSIVECANKINETILRLSN